MNPLQVLSHLRLSGRAFTQRRLRAAMAALLATCFAGMAMADEYTDVSQLLRQGSAAQALAKADAYITGKPRDPQMRFLRGVILNEQGRQADATQAFLQLTQDFPELAEPYNNLAALYAAQSQFDKARSALETAVKLNPTYATAHENLGDVYARLAGQSYGRAQQLEAGNPTVPPKLKLIRELFANGASSPTMAAPAPIDRKTIRNR